MSRMASDRSVLETYPGLATSDGAGVRLTRYIGSPQLDHLDPFLLLDHFGPTEWGPREAIGASRR